MERTFNVAERLPSVWDPYRRSKERGVVYGVKSRNANKSVDYISHNPEIKKLIKHRLEYYKKNGYSLLKIADYIGYDWYYIQRWLNSHSFMAVHKLDHPGILSLLRICGYDLKVVVDRFRIDYDHIEQFQIDGYDEGQWRRRNEEQLP